MSIKYPESWSNLNVVLSHDWLTGMRGGERVLELLGEGFPAAPIFSLIHNRAAISESINRHPITTSWLQHAPGVMKWYRYYLPFFTVAVEHMRPPAADLLISTSHCIAKGLRPKPGTKHLCYCFTPMRYAWLFYDEYFGGSPLKKAMIKPILGSLRDWDKRTADRVDTFVTLSRHVQARIKKFYGRDADVVYPPVNVDFYTPGQNGHDGFDLIVSALVPYKRLDLAVRAYNKLGYPLKIVGTGTEHDTSQSSAGSPTRPTASCTAAAAVWFSRARKTSALCPSKRRRVGGQSSLTARAACWKPWSKTSLVCFFGSRQRKRFWRRSKRAPAENGIRRSSAKTRNALRRKYL
jgi:hypothetical protein